MNDDEALTLTVFVEDLPTQCVDTRRDLDITDIILCSVYFLSCSVCLTFSCCISLLILTCYFRGVQRIKCQKKHFTQHILIPDRLNRSIANNSNTK